MALLGTVLLESAQVAATGAHDELGHAVRRIDDGRGCLGQESLVLVIVAVEDEIDPAVVEDMPRRPRGADPSHASRS